MSVTSDASAVIQASLGKAWVVSVDSPIGRKNSNLVFNQRDGVLCGEMADLFGTLLPLSNINVADDRVAWQLDITRPIKLSMVFEAVLADGGLTGRIRSKYPDIPFSSVVPAA